ncbi:MAG: hypothetical protein HYZ93_04800 [Candidatus Omnitrophica bacterium]|nr:hypothetical protein [Candidatus Omnitrophota bacterium]
MTMVMVMTSVLAVSLQPRIQGFSVYKTVGAGRKLLSDIRYTQQLAMSRGVSYGMEFDTAGERYRVFDVATGINIPDPYTAVTGVLGENWSSGFVVDYTTDPELQGVDLVSTNFGAEIRFDSHGRPKDSTNTLFTNPGSVAVAYPGSSETLSIDPRTGRTTLS